MKTVKTAVMAFDELQTKNAALISPPVVAFTVTALATFFYLLPMRAAWSFLKLPRQMVHLTRFDALSRLLQSNRLHGFAITDSVWYKTSYYRLELMPAHGGYVFSLRGTKLSELDAADLRL